MDGVSEHRAADGSGRRSGQGRFPDTSTRVPLTDGWMSSEAGGGLEARLRLEVRLLLETTANWTSGVSEGTAANRAARMT